MLLILLPLLPEHWDHRYKPPQPASCPLRFMQKPGQSSSPETLAELLVLGRVCIFFFFGDGIDLLIFSIVSDNGTLQKTTRSGVAVEWLSTCLVREGFLVRSTTYCLKFEKGKKKNLCPDYRECVKGFF